MRVAVRVLVALVLLLANPVYASTIDAERLYVESQVGVSVPLDVFAYAPLQGEWGSTLIVSINDAVSYRVLISNHISKPEYERYTVAHEFGHVYLYRYGFDTSGYDEDAADKFGYCYGSNGRQPTLSSRLAYGSCESLRATFRLLLRQPSQIQ